MCTLQKQELREQLKRKRKSLSLQDACFYSNKIADYFLSSQHYAEAKILMLFMSIGGEPDTIRILNQAWDDGKKVCIPHMYSVKGIMDAALIADATDVVKGKYGILVPNPVTLKLIEPQSIQCILVPGMSFDIQGHRLGMGSGYYDRFLPKTQAVTIGCAFSFMILHNIPVDKYDISVKYLLTDEGLMSCLNEGKTQ